MYSSCPETFHGGKPKEGRVKWQKCAEIAKVIYRQLQLALNNKIAPKIPISTLTQ
jgi:hypothetical protein